MERIPNKEQWGFVCKTKQILNVKDISNIV